MHPFHKLIVPATLLMTAPLALAQEDHDHGDMTLFGTAANPTAQTPAALTIEFDFADTFVHVDESQLSPGLFQTTEPGLGASASDEPDEGLFAIAGGVPVSLQITAIDPRVKLQFGATLLDAVGETALLGTTDAGDPDGNGIHTHPTWYVDLRTLSPNASELYNISFKLTSTSPLYTESEVFTATLTTAPVPEPAGLAVLGVCATTLLARRRRKL